jgi:ATP-dependent protease Clp ATPase subunit
MMELMFEMPSRTDVASVTITEDFIKKNASSPIITLKESAQ